MAARFSSPSKRSLLNPGGAIIPFFQRYDPAHLRRYALAASYLRLAPSGVYVDFGCGYGIGTSYVANRHSAESIGLDVDEHCVQYAQTRYGRVGLQFQLVDSIRIPLSNESAALITAFDVIEHLTLDQADAVFDEALRALRPDGILLGTTPNAALRAHADAVYHRHEFIGAELLATLVHHGFVTELMGLGAVARPDWTLTNRLVDIVPLELKRSSAMKILQSLYISVRSPRNAELEPVIQTTPFEPTQSAEILFRAIKRSKAV